MTFDGVTWPILEVLTLSVLQSESIMKILLFFTGSSAALWLDGWDYLRVTPGACLGCSRSDPSRNQQLASKDKLFQDHQLPRSLTTFLAGTFLWLFHNVKTGSWMKLAGLWIYINATPWETKSLLAKLLETSHCAIVMLGITSKLGFHSMSLQFTDKSSYKWNQLVNSKVRFIWQLNVLHDYDLEPNLNNVLTKCRTGEWIIRSL